MLTNQKILKRPKLLLYNATEQGDINRVREILSSLQQREQISEDEYETSIMAAAHNGNIEIAREILALRVFPWIMKFYAGENLKVSSPSVSNFTLWKNLPTFFNP